MLHILDPMFLIQTLGLIGVWGIVFAESGLLIGFMLPGDSLLFTAGFLASQGILPIIPLTIGCFIAAVLGDSVGYAFGRRVGPKIFSREDSWFFHKDHLQKAQSFYEKHGGRAIILARFMPVVRTFAPILAGVGTMHYRTFLTYNIVGGALWSIGLTLLGYFLGSFIPGVDRYLLPIILIIIFVSVLPGIIEFIKHRRTRTAIIQGTASASINDAK
ncbi:MAG TPA: VTT domain-containing protein [Candidatus Paceibacterota bacterium]|nr:VTT domain-containing protein [Candidatus Paceibacterota bacterium]